MMYSDNTILSLLSLIGAAFAAGLIYYRELYKRCEKNKKDAQLNRHLWDDWGE
jgi:hypothetical protein